MKAFMTPLTLIAVLLYSGATPLRCQEPPPPSTPADRAAVEAAVKRQEARRQMAEHMAKAREAIELAQAAAPVAPAALTPGPGAPSPAIELRGLQNRLQHIVHRGQASQGKALVIRTSDADAK